jgi:hypothetical protein
MLVQHVANDFSNHNDTSNQIAPSIASSAQPHNP